MVLMKYAWLLLLALAACESGTPNATGTGAGTASAGAALYAKKCALCHGDDGKMAVGGAKDLTASALTKDEVVQQIIHGKGSMPPYGEVLSAEEIDQIADYTLSLRSTQSAH